MKNLAIYQGAISESAVMGKTELVLKLLEEKSNLLQSICEEKLIETKESTIDKIIENINNLSKLEGKI